MRTLEYTLPDGSTGTATAAEVASAVENLLMEGTLVLDASEVLDRIDHEREMHDRHVAILQALLDRAIERGILKR